jgi:hypothetical protein
MSIREVERPQLLKKPAETKKRKKRRKLPLPPSNMLLDEQVLTIPEWSALNKLPPRALPASWPIPSNGRSSRGSPRNATA